MHRIIVLFLSFTCVINSSSQVASKLSSLVSTTCVRDSWTIFDHVELKKSESAKLLKSTDEISILKGIVKPALVYGKKNEARQQVSLEIVNLGNPKTVQINVDGQPYEYILLQTGTNHIETSVPEVAMAKEMVLSITLGEVGLDEYLINAFPVKRWTVFMVQHSHTDVGFTQPQAEVLSDHIRYIDKVIEYCEKTENYPEDEKFKWLCEVTWPVMAYLNSRPEKQVEKFIHYVKNGQIEVNGMYLNMSELIDENSFKTFLEPIKELKERGISVRTAMQNDVNGIAWSLADYMPDLGIKYFSMGQNNHRALLPFDCPTIFKWESPSGKMSYFYRFDHYRTGNRWGISNGNVDAMAPKLFAYLENLDKHGYLFDAISIQYSGHHFNNSPPSMVTSGMIRKWNEKYISPKLKSSLFYEFMDYIVENYDEQLPVFRGAYPDWWTDGFGSAARETAVSRQTHADMVAAEGLFSMASTLGEPLPPKTREWIRNIHENLIFYDEHTFGAAGSISDPMGENSQIQWAQKSSFAWEALKSARILYERASGLLQPYIVRGPHPTVTFYNTLNWSRSGLVKIFLEHELISRESSFRLIDDAGNELQKQIAYTRAEGTYYLVYAKDIPPMGYKTFRIIPNDKDTPKSQSTLITDNTVENKFYRIVIDPERGSIKSLYDKELNQEMVDSESPWLLAAFVYETLNNNRRQLEQYSLSEYDRKGLHNIQLKEGRKGDIYTNFFIEGASAGVVEQKGVQIEVRLFHTEKRIELEYTARKQPITQPDGIYVAFPFKLDKAKLYFDVQGGIVSSGVDQIEGTASDWNTVQNFVSARSGDMQFILGSNEIPLFQLGGIRTGEFQRKKTYEKPHVYSWVMNNYWTTNFRATQEGEFRWKYYLTSSEDTSNTKATRFGWGSRVPLIARVMSPGENGNQSSEYSAFEVSGDNLLVTSSTPSRDEGWLLLNIREVEGKNAELNFRDNDGDPFLFRVVNVIEEPLSNEIESHSFAPYDNKFIKVRLR